MGKDHAYHPSIPVVQTPSKFSTAQPSYQLSPGDSYSGLLAGAHGHPTLQIV